MARATVYSYISFLEATYFMYLISPFSRNVDREVSGANKVYICDNGVINLLGKISSGSLLENAVFLNLKKYGKLQYFEKRKGGEVDFILDEKTALEVKNKALDQDIRNVERISRSVNLKKHYIISNEFVDDKSVILAQDL